VTVTIMSSVLGVAAPRPAYLHEVYEAACDASPSACAVEIPVYRGTAERWSYAAVDGAANALAKVLAPRVTAADSVIAISLPRCSVAVYVAQLATLKCGAAYTCLDPHFPADRMRFVLNDSAPVAVLTTGSGLPAGAVPPGTAAADPSAVIDVMSFLGSRQGAGAWVGEPRLAKPVHLTPASLAYIIYTSGTTGVPKVRTGFAMA